jgi:hypothetical protein
LVSDQSHVFVSTLHLSPSKWQPIEDTYMERRRISKTTHVTSKS